MADAKKVLLVEDEAIIAMDLDMSLSDLGWDVIGPASTAAQAFSLIEADTPDIAILDFNIRGGTSEQIAISLLEKSVPVVFLSGDRTTTQIESLKDCRVVSKPVLIKHLQSVLTEILGAAEGAS